MTHEEAWKIIEECRGWNYEQKSIRLSMFGERQLSDDIYDERRKALKEAWKVVGKGREE